MTLPWFKVSDDLPSKAETTRIPRAYRRAALGLWALAGAWSAQQLTDGHIPAYMLEELSGTPEDAAWLVTAGYWAIVEDGWQFVEWAPEQPLREVVLEARRKNAAKVKSWRSRNQPSKAVTPPVTSPVTDAVTNPSVTLPPSHPNPVPSQTTSKEVELHVHPTAARSKYLESEFEQWWEVVWRKQAKPDAFKAFKVARKDTDLAVLIAGAQAYKLLNIGQDNKSLLKMPAGWLRDRRWEDEQVAYTPPARKLTRTEENLAFVAQLAAEEAAAGRGSTTVQMMCGKHPEYPIEWDDTCAACERTLGLPDGVNF